MLRLAVQKPRERVAEPDENANEERGALVERFRFDPAVGWLASAPVCVVPVTHLGECGEGSPNPDDADAGDPAIIRVKIERFRGRRRGERAGPSTPPSAP